MRNLFILLIVLATSLTASAQLVARMEVKEPIEGLCSKNDVYAIFPGKGQVEATYTLSHSEMSKKLNDEVAFLKTHASYKDKGMLNLIINCKGELVRCEMDNKTKSPELDQQIVDIFKTFRNWKPGKLNDKPVDTSVLISFEIKKGKITLE